MIMKKYVMNSLLIFSLLNLFLSCEKENMGKKDLSIISGLKETKYNGGSFSLSNTLEQNSMVAIGEKVHLYGPLGIDEAIAYLPGRIQQNIHLIQELENDKGFVLKRAFIATTPDRESGEARYQIQLSYLSNENLDDLEHAIIIIISDANPNLSWSSELIGHTGTVLGYNYTYSCLKGEMPMVQYIYLAEGSISPLNDYFTYDLENDMVEKSSMPKSYIACLYKHLLFHVAYDSSLIKDEEALVLAKKVILGN
jgi:hypothetical protein